MAKAWVVLKFGGTSVSGRKQWDAIAALAKQRLDSGYRVLLVCSAVAGVTDALQALADHAGKNQSDKIEALLQRHRELAVELEIEAEDLVLEAAAEIRQVLGAIANGQDQAGRFSAMASLLTLGEWLSTRFGERYLARSLPSQWVDARDALQAIPEIDVAGRRARLSARCESGVDEALLQEWSEKPPLLITQGFVAAHCEGGSALLGRGGSDTSAALLASRLAAEHVELWTDVPGFFSADPRVVPSARLLQTLNYDEALEMAASGAKVVHSRCIRAASDVNIPIWVRDLGQPDFTGTVIKADDGAGAKPVQGIRSVCRQSNIAVLLLQNLDTREHVGFLAWVFAQISDAGISVDLVATSETTTTVAFNKTSNNLDDATLEKLADQLRERCAVTVYPNCAGINLVGRGARVALADIDSGRGFFAERPLLMLSQSANDLCISILVRSQDAEDLLKILHESLIVKHLAAGQASAVFGPGWQDIQH